MSKFKLITTTEPTQDSILYIIQEDGEDPVLAYKSGGSVVKLNIGCSFSSRLLDCSTLYTILSKYFIKGTKFIISTYNPVLYYLFPGDQTYDAMFNPSTNYIPTLDVSSLVRDEVDGFSTTGIQAVTQDSIKSIKACDNWSNNPAEEVRALEAVERAVNRVFGIYTNFDELNYEKEVKEKVGSYSADISYIPMTVSLISETSYTDTINLEDWAYKSGKSGDIFAKLDVSFMYSKGNSIYGGMQTIEAFRYSNGNLISENFIINLGSVQLEYIERVLKIYSLDPDVNEAVFNDCVLTIGGV